MDKQELKKALQEQCEPFAESVRKKIEYLQSDEVFSVDEQDDFLPEEDLSLEAAFDLAMLNEPNVVKYDDPLSGARNQPMERRGSTYSAPAASKQSTTPESSSVFDMFKENNIPTSVYVNTTPTQQSIKENRQSIAAKIAALRGISVPDNYLNKKN
ncbi:MAG: hypothetical protein IJ525_00565 [Alphaproteobacteria bacterium]|nr:hypothetical protein [Alphaproteobacteria bacterium]